MARVKRGAGSESAGYHYDAVPKNAPPRKSRTPIKAPPKGMAAKAPAGDYAGAEADYTTAVAALPAPARRATVTATRKASSARAQRISQAIQSERKRRVRLATAKPKASTLKQPTLKRLRESQDPSKAVISTRPNLKAKPAKFAGAKTAGTPTRSELQRAKKAGTLKTNKQGFVTTPAVREAAAQLAQVQRKIAKHGPDLSNLNPAEAEVARLAQKAHRKYPDVPIPLAMAQVKQESGFNAAAVSSAGAQGLTQFIPSTAANYGVEYGTGKKEKRSQVFGQFALMHDEGVGSNPTLALNNYLGLHGQTTPSEYSANILTMAKEFKGLGKGNVPPKLRRRAEAAQAAAARVGLHAAPKGIVGPAPPKVVKRFKAIKVLAKHIAAMHIPYVYGGGHNGGMPDPSEGLDCSSSTVYLLRKAGINVPNITSGDFGNYFPSGAGAVTIFYNPTHVFLRIGDEYWGTSAGDSGSGGLGPHAAPSSDYLAQYSVAHVPGLGRKQALQLGISVPGTGSSGAFPGMTVSPTGTTATIDPAAGGGAGGAKKTKPGFSKSPIQLTPMQEYNRTKRKLQAAGVKFGGQGKEDATPSALLSELEQRYGKAAV